jgi:deoxyribonuclease (pyrimidine dimer)
MVRINLINPKNLADQHLIAEYDEILMLIGFVRRYPFSKDTPKKFRLGKGHINFFRNKLLYLKKRHELIKKEMDKRGFHHYHSVHIKGIKKVFIQDWKSNKQDKEIIKKRLVQRIKEKPNFYRYYSKNQCANFFIGIIKKSK